MLAYEGIRIVIFELRCKSSQGRGYVEFSGFKEWSGCDRYDLVGKLGIL